MQVEGRARSRKGVESRVMNAQMGGFEEIGVEGGCVVVVVVVVWVRRIVRRWVMLWWLKGGKGMLGGHCLLQCAGPEEGECSKGRATMFRIDLACHRRMQSNFG